MYRSSLVEHASVLVGFLSNRISAMTDVPDRMELNSILTSPKVSELTLTGVPELSPTDTLSAAAAQMRKMSHGSAVVCEGGKLVGIFTERDLLRVIGRSGDLQTQVSEVMTHNPQSVTTDDSLFDCVKLMDTGGYRRVPVVDSDGGPAGIVDVKLVAHFLVEYYPAAVYNQAAHDQLIAKDREGA